MEADELLQIIRRKPSFYLGDQKSLRDLHTFLAGYEMGLFDCGNKRGIAGDLRPFGVWVAKELGFSNPTSGWHNMIRARSSSDESAYDYFFELLDRFKKETGRPRSGK